MGFRSVDRVRADVIVRENEREGDCIFRVMFTQAKNAGGVSEHAHMRTVDVLVAQYRCGLHSELHVMSLKV